MLTVLFLEEMAKGMVAGLIAWTSLDCESVLRFECPKLGKSRDVMQGRSTLVGRNGNELCSPWRCLLDANFWSDHLPHLPPCINNEVETEDKCNLERPTPQIAGLTSLLSQDLGMDGTTSQ